MSFLHITDPKKRDAIVKEYLETKKNIQRQHLAEREGNLEFQREMREMQKPTIEAMRKNIGHLVLHQPQPLQQPAIEAPQATEPQIEEVTDDYGSIATNYLQLDKKYRDLTFGLYKPAGGSEGYYIGDSEVIINNDALKVQDMVYDITAGLMELLTKKQPKDYTQDDLNNYAKILWDTNAMRQNNDPNNPRPKSSGNSPKYNNIIKQIWGFYTAKKGTGLQQNPTTTENPIERLDLLLASKAAGNTGVKQELLEICDTLFKSEEIDKDQYKRLKKCILS